MCSHNRVVLLWRKRVLKWKQLGGRKYPWRKKCRPNWNTPQLAKIPLGRSNLILGPPGKTKIVTSCPTSSTRCCHSCSKGENLSNLSWDCSILKVVLRSVLSTDFINIWSGSKILSVTTLARVSSVLFWRSMNLIVRFMDKESSNFTWRFAEYL